MKKKMFSIALMVCLLTTSLLLVSPAYAQDEELPDPGLTPDSPIYFFDKIGKAVGMFFTLGDEAKAKKALEYAGERLAEARAMASANMSRETVQAADDYDRFMGMVAERVEAARQQGASENVSERIAVATSRHLSVLDDLGDRVPEAAREAITRARTASMNGQKNALRRLAEADPERAMEINAATIDRLLNRVRTRAADNAADAEEALADAAEFEAIEDEIAAIAEERGIDVAAIRERLAQSTANRFEVLSDVYDRIPEPARAAIANALENSLMKYERVIERVSDNATSANVSEEIRLMQRVEEELRERLRVMVSTEAQVADNTSDNATRARIQIQIATEQEGSEPDDNEGEPAASANNTGEDNDNGSANKRRSP